MYEICGKYDDDETEERTDPVVDTKASVRQCKREKRWANLTKMEKQNRDEKIPRTIRYCFACFFVFLRFQQLLNTEATAAVRSFQSVYLATCSSCIMLLGWSCGVTCFLNLNFSSFFDFPFSSVSFGPTAHWRRLIILAPSIQLRCCFPLSSSVCLSLLKHIFSIEPHCRVHSFQREPTMTKYQSPSSWQNG